MTASIDTLAIVLTWCAAHHGTISYRRDGAVAIRVGKVEVRGRTLIEAWRDAVSASAPRALSRQAKETKAASRGLDLEADRAANHTSSPDGENGSS